MANYGFIPEEHKKLVITMLDRGQTPADVENATRINVRTVQRVRRLWLSTRQVVKRIYQNERLALLRSVRSAIFGCFVAQTKAHNAKI